MSPTELQRYLHDHIPLSQAMQVCAVAVSTDSVLLSAPLAPNINHRETVFGGSASALAILAAWSLLHVRLRAEGVDCRLVIQRNTMAYARPIQGEFFARSSLEQAAQWPTFLRMLQRKGKARASVLSVLEHTGQPAGQLHGEFVALGPDVIG
jgi:thioesterase domain-containing protein